MHQTIAPLPASILQALLNKPKVSSEQINGMAPIGVSNSDPTLSIQTTWFLCGMGPNMPANTFVLLVFIAVGVIA
jgi:hypothetical protein